MTVIQGPWGSEPPGPDKPGRPPRRGGSFFPASRPIKADGGIKARSKRGAIGEQWWSRRFIEVLESFGMEGRLARGRNYARSGQVLNLEIGTGHVTSLVQGSRVNPYRVKLTVDPLTKPQWRAVERALARRALFRARLLAGEMPPEIEEIFADCGTPLFPRSPRDLEMSCTCPDWEVPCKHLAAVCYVLAEAFDDDPFGMLAWRGKGREDLLAALRRLTGPETHVGARPQAAGTDAPLAGQAAEFWASGLSQARLRALPPATAAPADLLLRGFVPPAIEVAGQDLASILRPAYELMVRDDLVDPVPPDSSESDGAD